VSVSEQMLPIFRLIGASTKCFVLGLHGFSGLHAHLRSSSHAMQAQAGSSASQCTYLVDPSNEYWPPEWCEERFLAVCNSQDSDRDAQMKALLENSNAWAVLLTNGRLQIAPRIAGWASLKQRASYGLTAVADRYMAHSVTAQFLLGCQPARFTSNKAPADVTVVLAEGTCDHAGREDVGDGVPEVACHAVVMVVKVVRRATGRTRSQCQVFMWDPMAEHKTEPTRMTTTSPHVFKSILNAADGSWPQNAEYFWAHGSQHANEDDCLLRSLQFVYHVVHNDKEVLNTELWKRIRR
jgi:hypothetical protein